MARLSASMTDPEILAWLGNRLSMLRDLEGLSLEQAGDAAGLSPVTVWRAEKGKNPNLLTVVRLLRIYGRLEDLSLLVPEAPPSPLRYLEESRPAGGGDR